MVYLKLKCYVTNSCYSFAVTLSAYFEISLFCYILLLQFRIYVTCLSLSLVVMFHITVLLLHYMFTIQLCCYVTYSCYSSAVTLHVPKTVFVVNFKLTVVSLHVHVTVLLLTCSIQLEIKSSYICTILWWNFYNNDPELLANFCGILHNN